MMINRALAGANQATGGLALLEHNLPVDVAEGASVFEPPIPGSSRSRGFMTLVESLPSPLSRQASVE
jgi:hypothetical protein